MSLETLNRFWLSLESLRNQTATAAEWQLALGPEWSLTQQYLRPSGQLGQRYPRSNPLGRRFLAPVPVIPHGERFLAVPGNGHAFEVAREQLVVFELYRSHLGSRLAKAVGCEQVFPECQDHQIGTLCQSAGAQFGVYWILARSAAQLLQELQSIVLRQRHPFVLLTPTHRCQSAAARRLLEQQQALLIPLNEAILFQTNGQPVFAPPAHRLIKRFLEKHGPAEQGQPPQSFFPTPHGANWNELRLRFVDGETVSIVVRESSATLNYTQLGMVNLRNGRPTVQWELLRAFAVGYGRLDWSSRSADRKNQKRKELLSKQLRRFFRIETEPFELDGNGWQTRFSLSPD